MPRWCLAALILLFVALPSRSAGAQVPDTTVTTSDSVTVSTSSDSLLRRALGAQFGKRAVTPPDTIFVLMHWRAPNRLGVGGVRDTTWAGTVAKSIVAVPNDSTGWGAPTFVSGVNRTCVSNVAKIGGLDTNTTAPRNFKWVSLWANRSRTIPVAVVKLTGPVVLPVGRRYSLAVGTVTVCSGY